jgi:GNAT superfamily N-acetyltransferase
MEIVNLSPEYYSTFYVCLEDWSEEMREAGNHKERWFNKMKDQGLRVKLAIEDGTACGMIQYAPAEQTFIRGDGLYFIYCIWVHGYRKGIGNYQKRGFGSALLKAAEDDVRSFGAKGLVAWGISLPFWMRAAWYRKRGYEVVDNMNSMKLVWKPFSEDAVPPEWIRTKKQPKGESGTVKVTAFLNGWCPARSIATERARRAASEFDKTVKFELIDTSDPETFHEWGISEGLYINGKEMRFGPPPSCKRIQRKIAKQVNKLQ